MSYMPQDWFLNSQSVFIPYGMFHSNPFRFFELFDVDELFIRPNSGYKQFTGFDINRENIEFELNALNQTSKVWNEELILITKTQKIDAEFRYVIAGQQVLTGSEYRWDSILDIRSDTLPICDELAEKVASNNWQMDIAYVVDIAYCNGQAKIVELNSFSSSGLYACDLEKIVKGISDIVDRQFYSLYN